MARTRKKIRLIEFKGTTLPVISIALRSLQPDSLATCAADLFGDEAFFDGEAAVLELDPLAEAADDSLPESPDWAAIAALFQRHGLYIIGVSGGSDALRAAAAEAGLPPLTAFRHPARAEALAPLTAGDDIHPDTAAPDVPSEARPESAGEPASGTPPDMLSNMPPDAPPVAQTLIIDRPLRSGQQVYARGGDLVMLAAVNAGAEVIADGSIHIYAPLRGRALAGASGDAGARIFTTRLEAELVSIAGLYRTFEHGIPDGLAGRPAQIRLCHDTVEARDWLDIRALKTD
ncbi:septum site-determining protein MinC [Dentiradicibacter hellwigii]|uniref:Probable septum site-determining protein MinC n=1 Tax=Dentiradicibacter hellwigii TaxID=3149053 RepID=A0ABV4UB89_9RHOO